MQAKITKRTVDGVRPEEGRQVRVYDTELRGFGLLVQPTGRRTFFVEWGPSNGRRRMKIGTYGPMTPEDARKRANEILGDVQDGRDPLDERDTLRKIPTFKAWVGTYMEHVNATKKRPDEDRRYLEKAVKAFGAKKLTDVDSGDVAAIVDEYLKADPPKLVAANRFLASIRACLQRAWRHPYKYIADNPARHLQPGKDCTPRDRVLTDDEMKRLAEALAQLDDEHMRAAFVMAAETGCRASEVLGCRWEDIDLDEKVWRLPDTKAGKPQFVPLTKAMVDYLKTVPRVGPYLVPGRKDQTARSRSSLSTVWAELREKAKLPDVHIHDLRRTFGLRIARKASLDVASKLLRHSSVKVTEASYAPFGLDDLRPALDKGGKLIPMVRKAKRSVA